MRARFGARWVASASLLLALTTAQAQGLPPLGGASPFRTPRVSEIIASAEAALAQADAPRALELFERAAGLEHASDIEVGLVRSLMQAGHYRRALAFAAHTAGAHAGQGDGPALYAWLLAAGGQSAVAQRLLEEPERRPPASALASELRQRLMAQPPACADACATGAATGLLIDGGKRAIAPSAGLPDGGPVWVRDGLGQTVQARLERKLDGLGISVFKLDQALEGAPSLTLAERDPFPGVPAHTIEYPRDADAAPPWPWLHSGFLGTVDPALGTRRLGIGLPPGPRGGPVFDAAGRLVGLGLAESGRPDRLLPVSALRRELGDGFEAVSPQPAGARMAVDEVYERGLRLTLRIVSAR